MTTIEQIKAEIERRFGENIQAAETYKSLYFGAAAKEDYDILALFEQDFDDVDPHHLVHRHLSTRRRLAERSKTPEGRESYEKVAEEMRKQIADGEVLENEISKSIEHLEGCTTKINGNPEYHLISDEDIRKFARHFARWGADNTPLPEDTVLFQKGVEEGKRLMMEEATEYDVDMHGEPITISLDKYVQRARGIFPGDKVRVIVLKKED